MGLSDIRGSLEKSHADAGRRALRRLRSFSRKRIRAFAELAGSIEGGALRCGAFFSAPLLCRLMALLRPLGISALRPAVQRGRRVSEH